MANSYKKPTSQEVEKAVAKAARAARRADRMLGQYNGTIATEPTAKQKAAWAAASKRLKDNPPKKKSK